MAGGKQLAFQGVLWALWALDVIAWILLLSGVSAMQADCGGSGANALFGGGSAGYLAPVPCDRLFSYAWWAVWYNFLLLIILAIMLIANSVYLFRGGLIALVAINIMLMIETANSFLYYNNVTTLSGSFSDRARVTVAGAIIKAIASFLLIAVLGFKDEYGQWEEGTATPPPAGKTVGPTITKTTGPSAAAHCPPGTVPVSTVAAEQRV